MPAQVGRGDVGMRGQTVEWVGQGFRERVSAEASRVHARCEGRGLSDRATLRQGIISLFYQQKVRKDLTLKVRPPNAPLACGQGEGLRARRPPVPQRDSTCSLLVTAGRCAQVSAAINSNNLSGANAHKWGLQAIMSM